jgi:hypothetical protein
MQNQNNRVMEEHLSLQNNQELLTQKPIKLLIVEDEIIVARQLSNSLKKVRL